jgi:glutamyl-tRNA(Gln) amidotransferase subunit E
MYPETDVPSVPITEEMLGQLQLPELFDQRAKRFLTEYGLNSEQARVMAASPNYQLFEETMANHKILASVVVRALETIPIELAREGVPVSNLTDQHYHECLALVSSGQMAKEGLVDLLRALALHPATPAAEAAQAAGLAGVDELGVASVVRSVVMAKADLVRAKGERAAAPLMGLVMKELRGKADGAVVSAMLKKEIQNILEQ